MASEGPGRRRPRPKWWTPPLNRWQTGKAMIVPTLLVAAFLFSSWPREALALTAAGFFLASRRTASRDLLGEVDWQLLVLFMALFVVNHALNASGMLESIVRGLAEAGIDLARPAWLFERRRASPILSRTCPARDAACRLAKSPMAGPLAGPILALASTLAGNLFIVGSIANIIVVDQAAQLGVKITWRDHARAGVPVTLITLALAAAWLWVRSMGSI